MERLLTMDKQAYVSRMQAACRRIMEQVAEAVNQAPSGNVISGSEMQVRDLMGQLRQQAFELAVQMRVDSTESSFSPSEGPRGAGQGEQGSGAAKRGERKRSDRMVASPVVRRGGRPRLSGGPAGG